MSRLSLVFALAAASWASASTQTDFDQGIKNAWPEQLPKFQTRVADASGRWFPSYSISDCVAKFGNRQFRCSLGKAGATKQKQESDGKSPIGTFRLLTVLYRAGAPRTAGLRIDRMQSDWGWCENPKFPDEYNRVVRMPSRCIQQRVTSSDELFEFAIVVDWNHPKLPTFDPEPGAKPVPGDGSAILVHLSTRDYGGYNYTGTAGCISFSRDDLLTIMASLKETAKVTIEPNRQPGPPWAVTFSN